MYLGGQIIFKRNEKRFIILKTKEQKANQLP